MKELQLPTGVMNVLIHYVLLRTDMKLCKPYLEKIASHWARKNVITVKEAMNLAKREHSQYQNWTNSEKAQHPLNQGKSLYEKIVTAIDKGYDDEQLGYYIRSIVNR